MVERNTVAAGACHLTATGKQSGPSRLDASVEVRDTASPGEHLLPASITSQSFLYSQELSIPPASGL